MKVVAKGFNFLFSLELWLMCFWFFFVRKGK
jgi:hypothetical protein